MSANKASGSADRERSLADTQRRLADLLEKRRNRGNETRPTGSVAVPTASRRGAGSFCTGATVSVTQVRGGTELGDLGRACLLEDVAIGEPIRFNLEDGPALVTSPVRSLQRTGARSIQVATGNSIYRLDLRDEPPAK